MGNVLHIAPTRPEPQIAFGRALLRQLTHKASELTAIPVDELRGPCRPKDVCWTRFAIMLVAHEHGKSYWQIGGYFNQRDHTSAINGVRRGRELERTNHEVAELIHLLREEASR